MSKTDHPRHKGSHRVGHPSPGCSGCDYCGPRPIVPARLAIEEGLAQMAVEVDLDERYTMRECMSEWEYLPMHAPDAHEEPLADWERALLDEPAWSSEAADKEARAWEAQERERQRQEEARYDHGYDGDWLMGVSVAELHDLFPDGGYVIEGPAAPMTLGKADAYLRTYELARLVGIETAHMVEYLRLCGEWVGGPLAYVALPVCEQMVKFADDLQAEFGKRDRPLTWAQKRDEWDAKFAARA